MDYGGQPLIFLHKPLLTKKEYPMKCQAKLENSDIGFPFNKYLPYLNQDG